MLELKKADLLYVVGGLAVSGTLINSFVRGINAFLNVGRSLGSAIRRILGNKYCSL